jgi:hypothetical protein
MTMAGDGLFPVPVLLATVAGSRALTPGKSRIPAKNASATAAECRPRFQQVSTDIEIIGDPGPESRASRPDSQRPTEFVDSDESTDSADSCRPMFMGVMPGGWNVDRERFELSREHL